MQPFGGLEGFSYEKSFRFRIHPLFSLCDHSHFLVSFIRGSTVPPPPLSKTKAEWGSHFVSRTIGSFGCEIDLLLPVPEPRVERDAVAACEHAKFSRANEMESEFEIRRLQAGAAGDIPKTGPNL